MAWFDMVLENSQQLQDLVFPLSVIMFIVLQFVHYNMFNCMETDNFSAEVLSIVSSEAGQLVVILHSSRTSVNYHGGTDYGMMSCFLVQLLKPVGDTWLVSQILQLLHCER